MKISVLRERRSGERRVALTPANVASLVEKGCELLIETGAGVASGYGDETYSAAGAEIVQNRERLLARCDILLCVDATDDEALASLREGQLVIGLMDPLGQPGRFETLARKNVSALALELVPRISRAQSMDVLSSMATLAGYKAVLLAASTVPRIFPMMMTAAGTLTAARVFVMGAGVAGLQAAATARRLGALVEAYDVRPAAREQILSVGARPVALELETEASEGRGGYATEQDESFLARQREQMAAVLAQQDVVITTAAIPGARAPVLITAEMVTRMKPGAVIVDLAAERGGNCELTQAGRSIEVQGVTIVGPENIAASVPHHASQMVGRNIENLLLHLLDEEGRLAFDFDDEILAEAVVTHAGAVCNARVLERLQAAKASLEEVA